MRRSFTKMVEEFELHWKNYVLQSLLATAAVFAVLLCLSARQAVIIASIGATTFIVFAMPDAVTAQPRNVIGGQLVGLACGSLCALIPHGPVLAAACVYALAVGVSMFAMVVTDTEHPPASGTALGMAITGFSWDTGLAVAVSVVLLSLAHGRLRRFLKDLT